MITRRDILKNIGAGGLAFAPFLTAMKAHAAGNQKSLPGRIVFVVKDNGLSPYGIQPQIKETISKKYTSSTRTFERLKDLKLNSGMKGLESLKHKVNIIQGLSSKASTGGGGGHTLRHGTLGIYTCPGRPLAETIDGCLAKKIGGIFPHIGFEMNPGKLISHPSLSAYARDKPISFYNSPSLAYKNIFGSVTSDSSVKKQVLLEKNILDFLAKDIRSLQKKLNSEEKEKLDHYVEGFETMSERQVKLANMSGLKTNAPEFSDKFRSKTEIHQLEAHFDMAAGALISGLTSVVTIHTDHLNLTYLGLGHDLNVHAIGHLEDRGGTGTQSSEPANKGAGLSLGYKLKKDIRDFHLKLIAAMARKFENIPEGDGTMLDNTLIVYLSESGDRQHTNSNITFPILTVGNLGRKFKTGYYMRYPSHGNKGHRTLANFHTSILHAAGFPRPHFGNKDLTLPASEQDGVLNELML